MSNFKRFIITILVLLLTLSFIDDLKKENALHQESSSETYENNIAHIKVQPGDTLLSITEEVNELDHLDINQIIFDFKKLNPNADPETLIPDTFYYFPLYNNNH